MKYYGLHEKCLGLLVELILNFNNNKIEIKIVPQKQYSE